MEKFQVSTSKKLQIVTVTDKVKSIVKESGVDEGICLVYVPHATAAVTINENHDPNLLDDILDSLQENIPSGKWRHDRIDGNGAAHIKAAIIGPSETIPIHDGKLMLGTWQGIMVCDFDGPRQRTVYVQVK